MLFVLDASVVASWALEPDEEELAIIAKVQLRDGSALVPELWTLEVRNALLTAERRGRISEANVGAFLTALVQSPIDGDHDADPRAILALARAWRLTVYDAAYLELALRRALPLASLDRALVAAARGAGVKLLDEM